MYEWTLYNPTDYTDVEFVRHKEDIDHITSKVYFENNDSFFQTKRGT